VSVSETAFCRLDPGQRLRSPRSPWPLLLLVLAFRGRSAAVERPTSSLSRNCPPSPRRTYRLSLRVLISSRFAARRFAIYRPPRAQACNPDAGPSRRRTTAAAAERGGRDREPPRRDEPSPRSLLISILAFSYVPVASQDGESRVPRESRVGVRKAAEHERVAFRRFDPLCVNARRAEALRYVHIGVALGARHSSSIPFALEVRAVATSNRVRFLVSKTHGEIGWLTHQHHGAHDRGYCQ